jgi:hypothetical protein
MVPLMGRVRAEFRVELLNAFDFVNYLPVTGLVTSGGFPDGSIASRYEVTGLNGDVRARIVRLVSRISW